MFRSCRRRCTRKREVLSARCGTSACPVRAGCGNGATVEPLRHRQTKGAATDMFYLTPPRHISTLPNSDSKPIRARSVLSLTTDKRRLRQHVRLVPILLKKSKIGRLRQSREGRLFGFSAAARLFKTNTRVRGCV